MKNVVKKQMGGSMSQKPSLSSKIKAGVSKIKQKIADKRASKNEDTGSNKTGMNSNNKKTNVYKSSVKFKTGGSTSKKK